MTQIAVLEWFDATGSTSYYDIWCDRALIVARFQSLFAAAYAIALTASEHIPKTNDYYHEPIPGWEKVIAVVPVCLAAINCPPRSLLQFRLFGFHHDELQRLLVFAISQTIQLLLCTLLTVADFIRHGNAPLFWLSLVLWVLPAALAFVHGVSGLHAICSRCRPYIELGPSEPQLQYNDPDDGEGPLARAFHSQQDLGYAPNDGDTTEPAMTALLDRDVGEIWEPGVSISDPRDNENRPATRANLMFQKYWHSHATLGTTRSSTRFRWQEELKNMKSGGMVFWWPFTTAVGLSILCSQSYGFTIRHTRYVTPEFRRAISIVTLVPLLFTFVANGVLVLALYRPWFTIIFLSLCGTLVAAIVWITAFIAVLTTFSDDRPYGMVFLAPYLAFCHCALTYTALKLEWDPDYDSLFRMFMRLKR